MAVRAANRLSDAHSFLKNVFQTQANDEHEVLRTFARPSTWIAAMFYKRMT